MAHLLDHPLHLSKHFGPKDRGIRLPTGPSANDTEGDAANANERETGDLLPSVVNLCYTTRGLKGNGGRSVTSTSVEEDIEALGARSRETGAGRNEVETR